MIPQRATSLLYNSIHDDDTSALHQLVDGLHSPIQLAAISNYKLAQLTFAPPDLHSLRKTAIIKNTVSYIYEVTPNEWLDDMTRWEFFTLDALDDIGMTQEGLERILSDYVNIMDSFKAINLESPVSEETTPIDDDHRHHLQQQQQQNGIEETNVPKRSSNVSTATQPSLMSETSISTQSTMEQTTLDVKEHRRKSFRLNQHRISWTSDTGLTSFAASQHLAGELMSLFDMEFKVEISVDPYAGTAPQLPELSYFKEKQHNRSSVDSFMCLIPAFESFQIDNYDGYSYVSKANKRVSIMTNGTNNKRLSSSLSPTRSSSLKYKNRSPPKTINENINDSYAKLNNNSNSFDPTSTTPSLYDPQKSSSPITPDLQGHKTLTKKKSIRKLVSLFGKKKLNVNESIPMDSTTAPCTFKSVSSTNLTSVQRMPSSYSSSETNLNKNNLQEENKTNDNSINNNNTTAYNQRPTNPTFFSDNAIYTNKNYPPTASNPSPISNITLDEKKRRRRSNSVPEISTHKHYIHFHQQQQQNNIEQSIKKESDPNDQMPQEINYLQQYANQSTYQKATASNVTLIPASSSTSPIEPHDRLPQSKSMNDFNAIPRRKQSLSRSPTVQGHHDTSKFQEYQNDPRLYHSTHDLSNMYTNDTGGIGNVLLNDSKDSVLSQHNPNKKSIMYRMTSFARRKKSTIKQPVQV